MVKERGKENDIILVKVSHIAWYCRMNRIDGKKMQTTFNISLFIDKEKEGTYFDLPFEVPENVSRIDITYAFSRAINKGSGGKEQNVIDLALKNGEGEFIGASGSNKSHVWVSEYSSTPGYAETEIKKGRWAVIVGAYKIAGDGAMVEYEFTYIHKERTLLKGDLHLHTIGSDGVLTPDEIVVAAKERGLQYLFITDHNNYFQNDRLKSDDEITVMPGVEWTHYKGHANMLGVKKPFDGAYDTNTLEQTKAILAAARQKGAIVSVNHPFCPDCGFAWGLDNVEYDAIEIWNGPMKQAELDCLHWWHGELCKGRRIPIVGGSDFHRPKAGRAIGLPTTCLYALSRAPSDINAAIREGCGYITCDPKGPGVNADSCGKTLGQLVEYNPCATIRFEFASLQSGDKIVIITDKEREEVLFEAADGQLSVVKKVQERLFYRAEVLRADELGLYVPVLISNPVYYRHEN